MQNSRDSRCGLEATGTKPERTHRSRTERLSSRNQVDEVRLRERESILDNIKSCVSEWYLTQAITEWSINTCSVLKHKFVVEFLGISFRTQNEMVLVIEFMQHGNLRDLLDRKGNNLPWKLRLRLLKDAAKGMYVSRSRSLSLNMIRIEGNTD